jgi:hypothetical protein
VFPFDRRTATWTARQRFQPELFQKNGWGVIFDRAELFENFSPPPESVKIRCALPTTNNTDECFFYFLNDDEGTVVYVKNTLYSYPNVPYRQDAKPINTTAEQVQRKVSDYAAMFGVTNIWDRTRFVTTKEWCSKLGIAEETEETMMRGVPTNSVFGEWHYIFFAVRNGFPTEVACSLTIADLPGAPLGGWHSSLHKIPDNLPTNVLITALQAKLKAEEYLVRYFPIKKQIPQLTFKTNSLQYVVPNFNYIQPSSKKDNFSSYDEKMNKLTLVWTNTFKKQKETSYADFVLIYVDAATGEMLGGTD